MKCPHCLENFNENFQGFNLGRDEVFSFWVSYGTCPGCNKRIIQLNKQGHHQFAETQTTFIYPKAMARTPLPTEVPERFAADYREACVVLPDSPKASAALSRYCLQHLLREKAGVTKADLSKEIQQVLDSRQLPPYIAGDLDAARNIGNFAAHPNKRALQLFPWVTAAPSDGDTPSPR